MNLIREIIQLGHPVLRRPAIRIENVSDPAVQSTISDMKTTLAATSGVGLAAPQIGESVQILIVGSRPTPRYPHAPEMEPVVMINPVMTTEQPNMIKDWEGCLSIPGIRARVPRYQSVSVDYLSETGIKKSLHLAGFPARVLQHEMDHLSGLVYLDKIEANLDIVSESYYQFLMDNESGFGN